MKKNPYFFVISLLVVSSCNLVDTPKEEDQSEIKYPPLVTTSNPVVSGNKITAGGEVTFDGRVPVTARGVIWSISTVPTINDDKVLDNLGVDKFTCSISNLNYETVYYVRAYAVNSVGTGFGEIKSIKTDPPLQPPTIGFTSIIPDSTTSTSAVIQGQILSEGAAPVTARGVVWDTNLNPTINNNKTVEGLGIGKFVSRLSGLTPNTGYYARIYATSLAGTAYGAQIFFTTKP